MHPTPASPRAASTGDKHKETNPRTANDRREATDRQNLAAPDPLPGAALPDRVHRPPERQLRKAEYHHCSSTWWRPTAIIAPHSAAGGCAPSPMKLKAAAIRIAEPRSRLACTLIGGSALSATC